MLNIIIIDDNFSLAELTGIFLERYYQKLKLLLCSSGIEAEIILKSNLKKNFDIIICDYIMPNYNGLELLESLRKNKINIPFILYTATYTGKLKKLIFKIESAYVIEKDDFKSIIIKIINKINNILNNRNNRNVPVNHPNPSSLFLR